ncbi:MAG: hypothetical protein EOO25_08690 [Comamonadaceae bacterium]|nr:MAG: hypothetical protein EOO25_08690 [Comamonadaceae bacterium]
MNDPSHRAEPVDIAEESVAGEEDPGASLDLPPRGAVAVELNDDNASCRSCAGGGMLNGGPCPDCDGTGRVGADPAA